ncbi:hypothetical protein SKAU_G00059780 [Synaphobranchus kaupii]|uniref:Uncharacterized protein n=1 Tax=Synaphobranchus kaupii TaxID=118154 RepID=A0A9Q1G4K4_SYNKA|nr:hypothetical protein SKAU_G00059780 [Synaphobranchus kaupii]
MVISQSDYKYTNLSVEDLERFIDDYFSQCEMEDDTHKPTKTTNPVKRRKADSSTSTDDLTATKIEGTLH